jgi:hypothetical protein
MSQLLKIVTCDWSSTSSSTSSGSSSSYVACSITSRRIIMKHLIILCSIVLRLCQVVLRLHVIVWLLYNIILLLHNFVCRFGLIELWRYLPSHHFVLYPIFIWCPFLHQLHSSAIFIVVAHWLAKGAIESIWNCHDLVSWIFHTIILPLVMDSEFLLPCTARTLDIHSCGVLSSCTWHTKWLLVCPCSYSSLSEMLDSSSPPSILR